MEEPTNKRKGDEAEQQGAATKKCRASDAKPEVFSCMDAALVRGGASNLKRWRDGEQKELIGGAYHHDSIMLRADGSSSGGDGGQPSAPEQQRQGGCAITQPALPTAINAARCGGIVSVHDPG
ncbi:hypothetical protein SETIT_9G212600v2 [Setaria italica]|uniref:Uncharacterized protein n=1 Tax=Setaria italica TaxID=4555 RepID=A0A368SIZ7_SETIT|nr:hypothetical protein SETIT_9G212600v2 [Setaria italica]